MQEESSKATLFEMHISFCHMTHFGSNPCHIPLPSVSLQAPGASTPTLLLVVCRGLGGLASGVLQHRLNLWPSQKARSQYLILDALRQPLDDRRRLPKRDVCLLLLSNCLIQPAQRRLDLPAFSRQAEVCRYLSGLVQVADGLLILPFPRIEGRQRPQVGKVEASIGSYSGLQKC